MSSLSRALYLSAGWAFVALAALGVVLPLLPTTPFLLLASSCFLRSSPRARRWLANSRVFGPMLRDWDEHKAVRRPVKVLAVVVVAGVLALTLARDVHWGVKVAVVALGLLGLTVIWRLPVVRPATASDSASPGRKEAVPKSQAGGEDAPHEVSKPAGQVEIPSTGR